MNDRWYEFGFRRNNQGAPDLVMVDAVELGTEIFSLLVARDGVQVLLKGDTRKKFCANEIWVEKTRRIVTRLTIFFAIVGRLLSLWLY